MIPSPTAISIERAPPRRSIKIRIRSRGADHVKPEATAQRSSSNLQAFIGAKQRRLWLLRKSNDAIALAAFKLADHGVRARAPGIRRP